LLDLIREHRTTLIFVNNRRLAERITVNLNQMAGTEIALTHHGSVSRKLRYQAESLLKKGKIPCIVATASLELGLDVGHIDLVVQVETPKEVARGLQRVGRAGHVAGMPSKGRIIPKTRGGPVRERGYPPGDEGGTGGTGSSYLELPRYPGPTDRRPYGGGQLAGESGLPDGPDRL
jgi:Lhr-like helicase